MKNIKFFITTSAAILLGVVTNYVFEWTKAQTVFTINLELILFWCLPALIIIFSFYLVIINLSSILALISVSKEGRIVGYWGGDQLASQVSRLYESSSEVRIKVTRGIGLFKKGGIFHSCIFDKSFDEPKIIKILLHYPCIKSKHIVNRANANGKTAEEYVAELFKVLSILKEHSIDKSESEDIFVKFYISHSNKEWRYYTFRQKEGGLLSMFNHYNKNVKGSDSKMFKALGGDGSLCDDLDKTFNRIWTNNSIELISNVHKEKKLVTPDLCGHPDCRSLIETMYNRYVHLV